MPRVVHFEINADRPERAIKFYESVFGWKIEKWGGPVEYWNIATGGAGAPGIDGGLMRRREPGDRVMDFIDVPSLDEYMRKVEAHGGKLLTPKMAIPTVGYMAYFSDTEGNAFGLLEMDEAAK